MKIRLINYYLISQTQNEEMFMESRQSNITHVVSENPKDVQGKNNKRRKAKVLKPRDQAIDYILNSTDENIIYSISRYLSVFNPKKHKVFIGEQCAEIHFSKITTEKVINQIWSGSSVFIQFLASDQEFNCECIYDGGTMVIRVKFKKKDVKTQEIIDFILRLRFLNFIKKMCNHEQVTNDDIVRWTKGGCENLIETITEELIAEAQDEELVCKEINDYFSQEIEYEIIPSELSQENSMDNIQAYATDQENQNEYSVRLYERADAVAYLESRISTKVGSQKKYNNDILTRFLWLFQKENHNLTISQQYAEIRANILDFSEMMRGKLLVGLKTFSCFFIPKDNLNLKCTHDRKTVVMRVEFKNGVIPQEINTIIRRINFINFAKNNLGYNSNHIHELFSLMIEREDIFDALREKIKEKHPNNRAILNRVNYYLPGLIDCEAVDRFLKDGDYFDPDTIIMPVELPPSLQPTVENTLESPADLDSTEITEQINPEVLNLPVVLSTDEKLHTELSYLYGYGTHALAHNGFEARPVKRRRSNDEDDCLTAERPNNSP